MPGIADGPSLRERLRELREARAQPSGQPALSRAALVELGDRRLASAGSAKRHEMASSQSVARSPAGKLDEVHKAMLAADAPRLPRPAMPPRPQQWTPTSLKDSARGLYGALERVRASNIEMQSAGSSSAAPLLDEPSTKTSSTDADAARPRPCESSSSVMGVGDENGEVFFSTQAAADRAVTDYVIESMQRARERLLVSQRQLVSQRVHQQQVQVQVRASAAAASQDVEGTRMMHTRALQASCIETKASPLAGSSSSAANAAARSPASPKPRHQSGDSKATPTREPLASTNVSEVIAAAFTKWRRAAIRNHMLYATMEIAAARGRAKLLATAIDRMRAALMLARAQFALDSKVRTARLLVPLRACVPRWRQLSRLSRLEHRVGRTHLRNVIRWAVRKWCDVSSRRRSRKQVRLEDVRADITSLLRGRKAMMGTY